MTVFNNINGKPSTKRIFGAATYVFEEPID